MPMQGGFVKVGSATVSSHLELLRFSSQASTLHPPDASHVQLASKTKGSDQEWQALSITHSTPPGVWHRKGSGLPFSPAATPPVSSSHPAWWEDAKIQDASAGLSEGASAQNTVLLLALDPPKSCRQCTRACHGASSHANASTVGHPHRMGDPACGA